jgi:hypothetical protein
VRNWPESTVIETVPAIIPSTCEKIVKVDGKSQGQSRFCATHSALSKRIQPTVLAPHELWLEQIAAALIVLINSEIQLHAEIERLVVECDELTPAIPKQLRHKVGAVETITGRIHARQLVLVVVHELDWALLEQRRRLLLVKRRHLVVASLLCMCLLMDGREQERGGKFCIN